MWLEQYGIGMWKCRAELSSYNIKGCSLLIQLTHQTLLLVSNQWKWVNHRYFLMYELKKGNYLTQGNIVSLSLISSFVVLPSAALCLFTLALCAIDICRLSSSIQTNSQLHARVCFYRLLNTYRDLLTIPLCCHASLINQINWMLLINSQRGCRQWFVNMFLIKLELQRPFLFVCGCVRFNVGH